MAETHLGTSYTCPVGRQGTPTPACDAYLAGSGTFEVANYEVFSIQV